MKIQVVLLNNEKMIVNLPSILDFDDYVKYADVGTLAQAEDGTRFRVQTVISYKQVEEVKNEQE
jgi:hypothetical protein